MNSANNKNIFTTWLEKIFRTDNDDAKIKNFLSTVPLEYCGWDNFGSQADSSGLCAMLGIAQINTRADILGAFMPSDAAALETMFNLLQNDGKDFEITVNVAHNGKVLKALGRRNADLESGYIYSVIWFYDISEFAQAANVSLQAVRAAEAREHEMSEALNALPFPLWLRNKQDFEIVWCNKAYSNALDESSASIIAEQKELPISDKNKAPINLRILARNALVKSDICTTAGKTVIDGKRKLIEVSEIPVKSEDMIVGIGLDITREEELETASKRLVASYHETMEQLSTAIAMFDADTRLEFYNSAYERMTGMQASWLNSHPKITDIIDKMRELRKMPELADYRSFKQELLGRFTSLIEPYEEINYLPDNSAIRTIYIPRPNGGLLMTMEDVTTHVQLETSYNTLMKVQQETMNNLSEGIAVFGEDGKLKLYNHAFADIWNLMPEMLADDAHISKIVAALKSPLAFADKTFDNLKQRMLENALDREPRKGRITLLGGKIVEFSVEPLPDGNILNTYRDITDSIKVEQALQERNLALEAAEKLKTDFIANVSYQLRTPLNSIMGFAEMLKLQYLGELNERQKEYMNNIVESSERLKSLINDILDLASIESGQMKLEYEKIKAAELINGIVDITQEWGRKQNVEMKVNLPEDDTEFEGDARRIKQALLNLVSNAFNFSPQGGTVTIGAAQEGQSLIIKVSDTGLGIAEDELERIFTPFDKINSGKTTAQSGAGLGLTLVKNIVELHSGKIMIESRENVGTCVTLKIPIEKSLKNQKAG